jgi:four helix bundle protein
MKTTTPDNRWKPQEKANVSAPKSVAPGQEERRGPDLSDRLLSFTANLLGLAGSLPEDRAGGHLAEQLLRAGTSAYFRHGEAEGSPSAKEFTEKFRASLTELRISRRALQLLEKAGVPCDGQAVRTALEEVDILIRIFFSSIRTLENKAAV